MGPDAADAVRLRDMLDTAKIALDLVAGSPSNRWPDGRWTTVARAIHVIGDAAGRISGTFRAAHGEIPWGSIDQDQRRLLLDGAEPVPTHEMVVFFEQTLPSLIELLEGIVPPQAPDDA